MLALIFGLSFWYDVIVCITLALLIFTLIKFPYSRWFIVTVLLLVLIGSAVFCGIELNYYYTASGGIYGELTGFFDRNTLVVTDLSFDFKNIMFTENGAPNEDGVITDYSIELLSDKTVDLNSGTQYYITVNDCPCNIVEYSSAYVVATYTYTFYDVQMNELLTDTLWFRFSFDSSSTYFNISTSGSSTAVEYWNYYFNRNEFIVRIAECESDDLLKDLVEVSFYQNSQLVSHLYVKSGSAVSSNYINSVLKDYVSNGFTINSESIDIYSYTFTENTSVNLSKPENTYAIVFMVSGYVPELIHPTTGEVISGGDYYEEIWEIQYVEHGSLITPPSSSPSPTLNYVFDYWALDGSSVDFSTYIPTSDLVFWASYRANTSSGGSIG